MTFGSKATGSQLELLFTYNNLIEDKRKSSSLDQVFVSVVLTKYQVMVSVLTVKNLQVTICCFACLLTSWSLSEAILCKGSAKYKLIFKGEWTRISHPEDFPARNFPHFSPVVGCSHNSSYVMWKPGMNATLGVKDVAERGT